MRRNLHRKKLAKDWKGPLEGVRVLDLSRLLVGNALTTQLADYGAEVIKVEQPGEGDGLRNLQKAGVSVYWKVLCRNKKSIAIDIKKREGVQLILDLIPKIHVVVENFKPETLEKIGLAPDRLSAANERLVVVRASGWGNSGPYSHKLGFGTLIEAFSGLAAKSGFAETPPLLPTFGLADLVCGLNGAFATMVALREAEKTGGKGQVIDLSILDSMAALLAPDSGSYAVTGKIPGRQGNRGSTAPRGIYKTADDRYVALSASTQPMTKKVFAAIGRPELIEQPEFRTNSDRLANADALERIIQQFIGTRTLEDCLAFFEQREITVGPVNDIAMFMDDPHVIEREVVVDMEDPELGWLPMPQPAVRLSRTPAAIRTTAPARGEHTRQVLSEIGIDLDRIDRLLASGTIEAATQDTALTPN